MKGIKAGRLHCGEASKLGYSSNSHQKYILENFWSRKQLRNGYFLRKGKLTIYSVNIIA